MAMMAMLTALMLPIAALASENDVIFYPDPEDAVLGHVYIGAVVEEGFTDDVTVELYPMFAEGNIHRYILTADKGYVDSDDIMVGEYDAIAYLTNSDQDTSATYSANEQEVTEGDGTHPYFAAVAGSKQFVDEYGWLSAYATEKGTALSGPLSWTRAKDLFKETIAVQNNGPDEDVSGQEGTESVAQADTSATSSPSSEEPAVIHPEKDPSTQKTDKQKNNILFIIIPAAAVFAAGVGIYTYTRRKKKKE